MLDFNYYKERRRKKYEEKKHMRIPQENLCLETFLKQFNYIYLDNVCVVDINISSVCKIIKSLFWILTSTFQPNVQFVVMAGITLVVEQHVRCLLPVGSGKQK